MIRAACGIVGLPNVGKSTLFNALTQSQLAAASNFPFCTIEPNVARVVVPDERLEKLARLANSSKTVLSSLELHDIAGLIKGASEGQGLGNKFLGNIRNVSVIVHVLRCFYDPNIQHVAMNEQGGSDPVDDLQVIETELLLADLATIEKRLTKKKTAQQDLDLLTRLQDALAEGTSARVALCAPELSSVASTSALYSELQQQLLSAKPVLYVCNTDESSAASGGNDMTREVGDLLSARGSSVGPVVVCASLEEEALTLFDDEEERAAYLAESGLKETGLSKVAQGCAHLLNQSVFYTVGPQEARSWSIPVNCSAREAAGKIHTDMSRGFIAAETISYDDYIAHNGDRAAVAAAGKLRSEGREYAVQSGDVMEFKFNVSR